MEDSSMKAKEGQEGAFGFAHSGKNMKGSEQQISVKPKSQNIEIDIDCEELKGLREEDKKYIMGLLSSKNSTTAVEKSAKVPKTFTPRRKPLYQLQVKTSRNSRMNFGDDLKSSRQILEKEKSSDSKLTGTNKSSKQFFSSRSSLKPTEQLNFDYLMDTLSKNITAEAIGLIMNKLKKRKVAENPMSPADFTKQLRKKDDEQRGLTSSTTKKRKPVDVSVTSVKKLSREKLEYLLGIGPELAPLVRQDWLRDIRHTIVFLVRYLKIILNKLIEQTKTKFFESLKELIDFVFFHIRPLPLLATFAELIVVILHSYGEMSECIWCCDKITHSLYSNEYFDRLLPFYEYKAKAHHDIKETEQALKCSYKMLFTAMYVKDFVRELKAYEMIGLEYYELGDIDRAKYFHDKAIEGSFEQDKSETRKQFPHMRRRYNITEAKNDRRDIVRDDSPPVSYYEEVPLEGSHKLLELWERRRDVANRDVEDLRKNIRIKKMKGSRYIPTQIALPDGIMGTCFPDGINRIGKVTTYNLPDVDPFKPISVRKELFHLENNTETMLVTHRSCNRSIKSFLLHHDKDVEQNGFIHKKYQTYLTESGLLEIIKRLNMCGLEVDKYSSYIDQYEHLCEKTDWFQETTPPNRNLSEQSPSNTPRSPHHRFEARGGKGIKEEAERIEKEREKELAKNMAIGASVMLAHWE